jgi:hypothetical protein
VALFIFYLYSPLGVLLSYALVCNILSLTIPPSGFVFFICNRHCVSRQIML